MLARLFAPKRVEVESDDILNTAATFRIIVPNLEDATINGIPIMGGSGGVTNLVLPPVAIDFQAATTSTFRTPLPASAPSTTCGGTLVKAGNMVTLTIPSWFVTAIDAITAELTLPELVPIGFRPFIPHEGEFVIGNYALSIGDGPTEIQLFKVNANGNVVFVINRGPDDLVFFSGAPVTITYSVV